MRLFFAIEFDDNVKAVLSEAALQLKESCLRGNYTRRENFHLTLVFLGETDRVSALRKAMNAVQSPPFTIHIRGTGVFRRIGGDIVWAGIEKNETLLEVYRALADSLRKNGFNIENRPFTPHLTLGREVQRADAKAPLPEVQEMGVKVNAITLMKSERIQGKLTYTPIFRKILSE